MLSTMIMRRLVVLVASCSLVSMAATGLAAPFTWSLGPSTAGNWTVDATNWTGATGTPWDAFNGPTNVAVFNSASGTATVVDQVFTNGLTFSAANGLVTGGTVTLSGTGVVATVSTGTSTLASIVTGSGFTKLGAGTLVLSASNTFGSGTMNFGAGSSANHGYLTLANGRALGNYSTINLLGDNASIAGINLTGDITANYALRLNGRTNNATAYQLKNLSGNNTWAGNITIVNTGGSYMVLSDSGTLTLSGTQNHTLTSNRGFIYSGSGSITITGPVLNGGTAGMSVSKSGVGTLTLSGNNTYALGTTVNGGVVRVTSNSGLGTGAVTIGGNSSVVLDGVTVSNTFTVNGGSLLGGSITAARLVSTSSGTVSSTLMGTGGLTKSGTTRLALTGTSTFTGVTLVSGGTLALGNAVALQNSGFDTASTGVFQLASGSTVTLGGVVGSGVFAPTGYSSITSLVLNAQPGSTFTYSGNLANGAAGMTLTKSGQTVASASAPGIQVLSGTSLYTGPTSITGGVLQFARTSALYGGDTAKWTAANLTTGSGGALAVNVGGAGEFTLADVATLLALSSGSDGFLPGAAIGIDTTNAGGSLTYATPLADGNGGANSLGLVKLGSGTLALTAPNTYTGATTVAGGAVVFSGAGSIPTTSPGWFVSGSGASLDVANLAGPSYTLGALGVAAGGTLNLGSHSVTFGAGTGSTVAGTLVGTGDLIYTGTSVLTLSSSNGYAGPIALAAGAQAFLQNPFGLGDTSAGTTLADGSQIYLLSSANSAPIPESLTFASGTATLRSGNAVAFTLSGSVALDATAAINNDAGSSVTLAGPVVGAAGIVHTGGGSLVLTNTTSANTFAGGITQAGAGGITIGAAGSQGTGTITFADGGSGNLTLANVDGTITNNIVGAGGTGGLTKSGTGTAALAGVNTYTGTTTVASGGGALRIDAVSALPAASTVVISKGGTNTGSLVLNTSGTNVYANPFGTFFSSNGLANGGTPNVRNLQGDNTLTADMTIAATGGNGMNFTSDGGLLTLAGTLSNNVASSTRTVSLGGSGNGQVTGPIVNGTASGAATNLVKSGAGTWSLANTANSFTGTPAILDGVLDAANLADVGQTSSLGAGSTIQFSGQGTSGTLRYTGATDQSTNRTLQIDATGGAIDSSGAGALAFTGGVTAADPTSMTLTFTSGSAVAVNVNAVTPGTVVGQRFTSPAVSGTVTITAINGNAYTLSSPALLSGGSTATFVGVTDRVLRLVGTNTGANTIATTLADSGAGGRLGVTKDGPGTWTLANFNSYTGPTTVSAGTLIVGPSASVASSRMFSVAAGSTLDVTQQAGGLALSSGQALAGAGLVAGSVSIGSTAVISPGSSPGTLTISQDLALGGGGNYNWQMLDATGAAGTGWDLLSTATLTLSSLTSADPFNVNLWSLASTNPDVNGNAANFDASAPGSWRILTSGAAISGFDASHFRVNTLPTAGAGGFSNPLLGGTFSVGLSGDGLGIDLLYAPATPYTWYGNGATAGGSGTWSPVSLTWNDGATVVAWDPTRNARFDSTAGTVTVSGSVTAANGLNFVSDGYTLTGDTLALTAANRATNAVNVAAGATVTVTGGLSAENGFSKTGAGRMLVTGDVVAGGGASVTSGTLAIGAGGTAGSLTGDASIAAGAVLVFDRSDAFAYSGGLSGDGAARMQGTGMLMLTGSGCPTGGLVLAGGTVALASPDALGSAGTLSFTGGTLQYSAANTNDYSARFSSAAGQAFVLDTAGQQVTLGTGLMSDGGSLTKLGDGTLVLAGVNTYSGTTTITAGSLQLGSGGAGGSVAGAIVNDGTLILNRSDSYTLSNAISGTGVVRKLAANTVTISSSNSYTGGTSLEQGNLQINAAGALGSGTVTITNVGGNTRLLLGGTDTILANPVVVSGVQNPGVGNGVLWAASGTATLAGPVTFDNASTASGGMLGSSGSATLVIASPITVTGPSVDFSQRSGNVILSGTGSTGWGTFLVTGTLNNGATDAVCTTATLRLGASGAATYNLAGYDQTLAALSSATTAVVVANSSTTRDSTLTIAGGTSAYSGQIADSVFGGTRKVNLEVASGTFALTGSTSFTGLTRIRDGALDLANANALGGSTLDMNAADLGVLTLTATTATSFNVGALTGSRGIDVGVHTLAAGGNGQSTTYTGVVSGAGGLAKSGSGTLVLTATQAYTGSTGVGGGTLQLTANDQLVTTSTLAFTGANATLAIGSLGQTVAAITTGNNAALDGMAVTGSAGSSLTVVGPGNVEVGPGGAVSVAGSRASLNLSALSTFTYANAAGTVRVGLKGGASNTAAPGTSVLTLAQSNSITAAVLGVADVSASNNGGDAQLLLGQSNTFSIGAFNQSSGGRSDSTVRFATGLTNPSLVVRGTDGTGPVGSWTVGNVATFATSKTAFTATADFSGGTLDASVTTLTIGQANTTTQTGRTGVQTSAFTMGSGTLDASSIIVGRITGGTAGSVASGTFAANATLSIASPTALVRVTSLTLAENSILGTGTTGSFKAVSGTVSLSAGTLQAGSIARGAQTGNANSVSAGITWSGGVITNLTGSDLAITAVPITVASGTGTFLASGANTITVAASSPISGAGALVKSGNGTLVLGGDTTYAGPTAVDAGTLVVNGINGGTGAVSVAAGAILAGTGTVGGATTIASGATLSPGASPGTLTFGGDLTWNAGGNYNWQMLSGTGSAGALDAWDLASVTGTLAIASTSADPFKVNLWTLAGTGPDVSGPAANFDASQNYTWRIASAAGGITGFAADKFTIVTGATNGTGGFANEVSGGTFSIAQSGNDLNLVFTSASGPSAITINVPSGTQTQTQAGYPTLSGSIPVIKTGAGTLVVDQANPLSGSTTVQGGVLQLANGSALSASRLVVVAGGTGQVAPYLATSVASLDLASGDGLVDLTNGFLTISSGMTATELVAEILEGRGDGSWTGTSGITSSVTAAEVAASVPRAVGWIDNGDGSLSVAYAAPGDTNIDWSIDILDASNFLAGGKFDTGSPALWIEGDFSYDGVVDILDAADFFATGLYDAGNYNTAPGLSGGVAAVPEPATVSLLLIQGSLVTAWALLRRRKHEENSRVS